MLYICDSSLSISVSLSLSFIFSDVLHPNFSSFNVLNWEVSYLFCVFQNESNNMDIPFLNVRNDLSIKIFELLLFRGKRINICQSFKCIWLLFIYSVSIESIWQFLFSYKNRPFNLKFSNLLTAELDLYNLNNIFCISSCDLFSFYPVSSSIFMEGDLSVLSFWKICFFLLWCVSVCMCSYSNFLNQTLGLFSNKSI